MSLLVLLKAYLPITREEAENETSSIHSLWTVTFLVAVTVDEGVAVVDRQVYCPPWDVCRGLNEIVRMVVEPLDL